MLNIHPDMRETWILVARKGVQSTFDCVPSGTDELLLQRENVKEIQSTSAGKELNDESIQSTSGSFLYDFCRVRNRSNSQGAKRRHENGSYIQ